MIGYLKGTVKTKSASQVIILVSGVGYLVTLSLTNLLKTKEGENLAVFTCPHIKEDAFDLYGFFSQKELDLFKLVMTVSGIGPKTALLVVDKGVEGVQKAIKEADLDFFVNIPRLGRKNAQKVIIELKNKIGGKDLDLSAESEETVEVVDALKDMGYSKQEALKAVQALDKDLKIEQKITQALKQLGKSHG